MDMKLKQVLLEKKRVMDKENAERMQQFAYGVQDEIILCVDMGLITSRKVDFVRNGKVWEIRCQRGDEKYHETCIPAMAIDSFLSGYNVYKVERQLNKILKEIASAKIKFERDTDWGIYLPVTSFTIYMK